MYFIFRSDILDQIGFDIEISEEKRKIGKSDNFPKGKMVPNFDDVIEDHVWFYMTKNVFVYNPK